MVGKKCEVEGCVSALLCYRWNKNATDAAKAVKLVLRCSRSVTSIRGTVLLPFHPVMSECADLKM